MNNPSISYRPDIDGLRAIAIISVLLYHLGISFLPGGFVGVDIFFVISGYLISKIIYKEYSNKSFSLTNFYVRRARRILPALLSVFALTSIFAYKFLYPSELVSFAKSAIAAALFSSNIYFYTTLNYFAPTADEIPFLHLWSLGVEEQFYLLFPFLIFLLRGRKLTTFISGLLIISLISSIWILTKNYSAGFYLIPFRAFELLIGSVLAIPRKSINNRVISNTALLIGLAFILISILAYGSNTTFPGVAALLPCVGAALVIYGGENKNIISESILGNRIMVFMGKISYSLYLIHWPVIVFGRRIYPHAQQSTFIILVIILSVALSFINYKFIEQIFRHSKKVQRPIKVFGTSAALLCIVIAVSGFTVEKSGFPADLDSRTTNALSFLKYNMNPAFRSGKCFLNPEQGPSDFDKSVCLPQDKSNEVILWGDSHAAQLFVGLQETLGERGYSLGQITSSACAPIIGRAVPNRPHCKDFNDMALPLILKEHPKIVIITAAWFIDDEGFNLLEKTLDMFKNSGIKIVLLGETPYYKKEVPLVIAEHLKSSHPDLTSRDELETKLIDPAEKQMSRRFGNRTDLKYISVMNVMCPGGRCPLTTADETPVAFDLTHLTDAGSRLFAKELTPLILSK